MLAGPGAKTKLDLNVLIREVVAVMHAEMDGLRILQQIGLSDNPCPVVADHVSLKQVLLNLITNAIEAMAVVTDRPLVLSVTSEISEAQHILVKVQDSGNGIEPDHMDRVFEALFTTKPNGMRIGLALCRSIVDRTADASGRRLQFHTGRSSAWFSQKLTGRTFSLPSRRGRRTRWQRGAAQGAENKEQADTQSIVFVVDDDTSLRDRLKRLFRSWICGLRLSVGARILEQQTARYSSCLVLDVRLPGLSGLDFRPNGQGQYSHPHSFHNWPRRHPNDCEGDEGRRHRILPKPFRDQDMLDAVRLGIERSRPPRGRRQIGGSGQICALTPREQEVCPSSLLDS